MFTVEKTKRKNDAPRARRYTVIALVIVLAAIFITGIILQSLIVLPDPQGLLYYSYTINPTYDVYMRHDFAGTSSASSHVSPLSTLPSEAATSTPQYPREVVFRDIDDEKKHELVVRDAATHDVIRVLGLFYTDTYQYLNYRRSPDGQWVVFTAYNEFVSMWDGKEAKRDLWMAHIETGEIKRLSETDYEENSATFTPDGAALLYLSWMDGTPRLYRRELATGTETLLTPDLAVQFYSWSPDKQGLIFKTYDHTIETYVSHQPPAGALYRLNLASGTIIPLIPESVVYLVIWSPDSEWIAFTTYDSLETLKQRPDNSFYGDPYYDEIPSTLWLMRPDGSDRHTMSSARFPLEGIYWRP